MKVCLAFLSILCLATTQSVAQSDAAGDVVKVKRCIQQDSKLVEVDVNYHKETGAYSAVDITGLERPADEVYPTDKTYAAGAKWYINNEPVKVNGASYVKYGLPRILGVSEVESMAVYSGVPVYAESPAQQKPEVIYVPVRTGCEFQPYRMETK